MNMRLTGGLLALLIALAASIWYFDVTTPAKKIDPNEAIVFALKPEDVARLDIVDPARSTVVERVDGGTWTITAPQAGEADSRRIDDAIGRIAKLVATRKVDQPGDLGQFGLAVPTSHIVLKMKDGAAYDLAIGARTPDGANLYVKRADQDPVYVAPNYLLGDVIGWVNTPPKPQPTASPSAPPIMIPAGPPKP